MNLTGTGLSVVLTVWPELEDASVICPFPSEPANSYAPVNYGDTERCTIVRCTITSLSPMPSSICNFICLFRDIE